MANYNGIMILQLHNMYPMINREMYNQYHKTAMEIVTQELYSIELIWLC